VFITKHDEVWEVGVRDLDGEAVVKEMDGIVVKRGVAVISKGKVLFNRVHGDEAKEILADFEAKVGRLFNQGASDGK
jgi:hypothetical protein